MTTIFPVPVKWESNRIVRVDTPIWIRFCPIAAEICCVALQRLARMDRSFGFFDK